MSAVNRLSPSVLKWIYKQGWTGLRPVQEAAVNPIMSRNNDVIISAATAAGKTEAFFLPALSVAEKEPSPDGFDIIYVSPLKALINDQQRRLSDLCGEAKIEVTAWHGDSSVSKKKSIRKNPRGVLLITPESLEALFMRHPKWLKDSTRNLSYIVIDEFHSFLDSVRGVQLVSQLNRLEHLNGRYDRPIPRVALSATLGNIDVVPSLLRPNESLNCETIVSNAKGAKLLLKIESFSPEPMGKNTLSPKVKVARELYDHCRGGNHLVFANSRSATEEYSSYLETKCEKDCVPNEFFPHHGSLSKYHREELEQRLQRSEIPTTAICTMTLELGIDIGKTDSVVQIGSPHSVSSLRQRMGRSGRRDGVSVLRLMSLNQDKGDRIIDLISLEFIQMLAIVKLMIIDKWFEPPNTASMNLSTLLHQVLSVISQWGGVQAGHLYSLLCRDGVFVNVSKSDFKELLISMSKSELIRSLDNGEIILDDVGESLTEDYRFFAAFHTPEEYKLYFNNKEIGTLPADSIAMLEQTFVFAGKGWRIADINHDKRIIQLARAKKGAPPIYTGESTMLHTKIREEMFKILSTGEYPLDEGNRLLNSEARSTLRGASEIFNMHNLDKERLELFGGTAILLSWLGDKQNNLIIAWLLHNEFEECSLLSGIIAIPEQSSLDAVKGCLTELRDCIDDFDTTILAGAVADLRVDKFDEFLSRPLLMKNYSSSHFDKTGIKELINYILEH